MRVMDSIAEAFAAILAATAAATTFLAVFCPPLGIVVAAIHEVLAVVNLVLVVPLQGLAHELANEDFDWEKEMAYAGAPLAFQTAHPDLAAQALPAPLVGTAPGTAYDLSVKAASRIGSSIFGFGGMMSWMTSGSITAFGQNGLYLGSTFYYMTNAARMPGSIGKQVRRFNRQIDKQFKRFIIEYANEVVLVLKIVNALLTVFLIVMAAVVFFATAGTFAWASGMILALIPFVNAAFYAMIALVEIMHLKLVSDKLLDKAKFQVQQARAIADVMNRQADEMDALADLLSKKNKRMDVLLDKQSAARKQLTQQLFDVERGSKDVLKVGALGAAATIPFFFRGAGEPIGVWRIAYAAGMLGAAAAILLKPKKIPEKMQAYFDCKKVNENQYCINQYVQKNIEEALPEIREIPIIQKEVAQILERAKLLLERSDMPLEQIQSYVDRWKVEVNKAKISMQSTGTITAVVADITKKSDYHDDRKDQGRIMSLVEELKNAAGNDPAKQACAKAFFQGGSMDCLGSFPSLSKIIYEIKRLQKRIAKRNKDQADLLGAIGTAEAAATAAATGDWVGALAVTAQAGAQYGIKESSLDPKQKAIANQASGIIIGAAAKKAKQAQWKAEVDAMMAQHEGWDDMSLQQAVDANPGLFDQMQQEFDAGVKMTGLGESQSKQVISELLGQVQAARTWREKDAIYKRISDIIEGSPSRRGLGNYFFVA